MTRAEQPEQESELWLRNLPTVLPGSTATFSAARLRAV
jgi:hypothetical protein